MNLEELIKKIRSIIGKNQRLTIQIFSDNEICIELYEVEIPIMIVRNKEKCFIEVELMNSGTLSEEILLELHQVCKLINDNIQMIKSLWG